MLLFNEFKSGIGMQISFPDGDFPGVLQLPPAISLGPEETYFVTNGWELGEFGSLYVALHIAGNLVRYYPDVWMPHAERSTPPALVIQELCESATTRLPVLLAGELDRICYASST